MARMLPGFLLTILLCLGATHSAASEAQRLTRLNAAFQSWLDARDLNGVLAVHRNGQIVGTFGQGMSPDEPVELASLSKAITAICAAELVAAGTLNWHDTTAALLGSELDLTLAQLVTHTGGLAPDQTQTLMPGWLDQQGTHQSRAVLDSIETRGGAFGDADAFEYNNENYALIALMIETASGQDYATACTQATLAPAGVSAKPSPRSGAYLPWGGWQMTAGDHARWHAYWFGGALPSGTDPRATPAADLGRGAYYGLGTFFRVMERGNTFWHFGALCFPGKLNIGSFVATWFADWTVVAAYDGCVDFADMGALDAALVNAALGALE